MRMRGSSASMTGLRGVGALALAAAVGAGAGWWVPRGPVTTAQAVLAVLAAVVTGGLSGWWMRSRWALVLAPAVFALAFEVARVRVDGPTVDGVRLDGVYGVIALVAGRGVDALLVLAPMVLGATWGAMLARRRHGAPGRRRRVTGRGVVLGTATVAVIGLVAGLLRPPSTPPILDADGERVPGSIAELVEVPVGGHDQAVMLRGTSRDAPVLLYLEGGPGGTGIGRIRRSGTDLERSFVVATWDQRGAGKSYDALDPTSTLTVDQAVADTLAVTDYLRTRFAEEKIYLVGSSWGTIVGALAAQRSPGRYHAYVGTGQMVDPFETDRLMYAESISDALARGDRATAASLRALGPPPYEDTLDYPLAIASDPKWFDFEHGGDHDPASEYPASLFVPEYSLIEQLRGMAAIAETYAVVYPQLAGTDFRVQVPRLDVPVYLVEGRHEALGRVGPAREWFEDLSAPSKQYVVFPHSGHTPQFDAPGRFARLMAKVSSATARPGT